MALVPQFPELVQENLRKFMDSLGDDAALFVAPHHHLRNGDAEYPYRQSSDILYLTGWTDAEMAVFINPKAAKPVVMFVQPKDPAMETWTGLRPGIEGAIRDFGASDAFPYAQLAKQLPNLLVGVERLHYRFAENPEMDKLLLESIAKARKNGKNTGLSGPSIFCDPSLILHQQRLCKSEKEIAILKKAAEITNQAHREAMGITKHGVYEYELDARINYVFRSKGGNGPGYTTIVGGGNNAVILHYISNDKPLEDGTLVCVDAGCEYGYYTADVTRTWPVNGKFTEPQAKLYQAVLDAEMIAIATAVPGKKFMDVHNAAILSLTTSMVELGILEGDVQELIEKKTYRKYFMHGTSHWLGMDVHDVGDYVENKDSTVLKAGMVLTVEPGIYIPENDEQAPAEYRGMGIRIEDDILITQDGNDNLTKAIPKTIADIEAVVGKYV